MTKHLIYILAIIFTGIIHSGNAQTIEQDLKGVITDQFTENPVKDALVSLIADGKTIAETTTDHKGVFTFEKVLLGTYNISMLHPDYIPNIVTDISVQASRSTHINLQMEVAFKKLEAVEITSTADRNTPMNQMATVSAIPVRVIDAKKIAGSLDDPIRVAGTRPGVTSDAAFSENFISIRGNSPRGLKYRIEGVELMNPTHFARIGSSGGTFTVFSMQLLGNSDFYIGAFPAEYGNALSGIFDVNFRRGNADKNEFTLQIGTLGVDLASEGPINKDKNSSYLVNYRYATVGMARFIGYPTQPTYQDLSFNLQFPTKRGGNFKFFGIAGMSDREKWAVEDSTLWTRELDRYNLTMVSNMATVGLSYTELLGESTVIKSTVLGSMAEQIDNKNYLLENYEEVSRQVNEYSCAPVAIATSIKHRFGYRHQNKTGATYTKTNHKWSAQKYNFESSSTDTMVAGDGHSQTVNLFSQSRFLINEDLALNAGVHFVHLDINDKSSIEPRIGLSWKANHKNKLSLAYGKHSQIENFATYQYRTNDSLGNVLYPNQALDFIKAHHIVAGWQSKLIRNHFLNVEVYYQSLYDIPVEQNGSFSVVNIGELDDMRPLVNDGTGENYGIDVGLQRYTEDGLYYMINTSIFESHYTGGDGVKRDTEFDQNFNIRFLAGKEYLVGEKKGRRNFVGWNTNLAIVGGRPYTPVDLDASRIAHETILMESMAYSLREENLIFVDATVTFKTNRKDRTGTWSLQVKNLFSNGNAIYREYDSLLDEVVTVPSSSFFPNLSYRLAF